MQFSASLYGVCERQKARIFYDGVISKFLVEDNNNNVGEQSSFPTTNNGLSVMKVLPARWDALISHFTFDAEVLVAF